MRGLIYILLIACVPLSGQYQTTGKGKFMRSGGLMRVSPYTAPGEGSESDSIWYELAHDLYVHTPESQTTGDRILELTHNRNWEVLKEYEWIITDGSSDFYVSDSILYASTTLTTGSYQLHYLLRDSIIWDTASIYVTVTDDADNYYIDFDWTGTESGTRSQPWNSFADYSYSTGKNYYFKRGSSINNGTNIEAVTANNVVLGAYGNGERPLIMGYGQGGSDANININAGVDNVTIRDIEVWNTVSAVACIFAKGANENLVIDNIRAHGDPVGGDTTHYQIVRTGPNIIGGRFSNNELYRCNQDGLAVLGWGGTPGNPVIVEGNYIHDINLGGANAANSGDCVDWHGSSDGHSQYVRFRYNFLSRANTQYKHGLIYTYGPNYSDTSLCETIIEYNRLEGWCDDQMDPWGQNGISHYGARGIIIRYNTIRNWTRGIYNNAASEPPWNESGNARKAQIYGNLIENIWDYGIDHGTANDSSRIYNNTLIDFARDNSGGETGIRFNGVAGAEVYNNIFYTTSANYNDPITTASSTVDEDYNLFYPDAGTWSEGAHSLDGSNPGFVSGYDSNYEINASSSAYHSGKDVGLDADGWGTEWGATPSMGYKEVD